ncbi:MAG: UDP-N-acetylenolpyruvoylglucosamine reductase, partial [Candidatus Woesebacteria bacterium GW2011_GWB1_45_5]
MGTKTNIRLNKFSFSGLTTFKVGGSIRHYKEVSDKNEVVRAVRFAKGKDLPIFIIGGGSDILVSDRDFEGVVIKYTGDKIEVVGNKVMAEAGVDWDNLVKVTVDRDLQGIECLSGIPGTAGAAPIQNIGAYGQELKDVFVSLTAYDIKEEKFVVFENKDCLFSYRESC